MENSLNVTFRDVNEDDPDFEVLLKICEKLIGLCSQHDKQQSFDQIWQKCQEKSLGTDLILPALDYILDSKRKYGDVLKNFNFESLFAFLKDFPFDRGLITTAQWFFTAVRNCLEFQFNFVKYAIESNQTVAMFSACEDFKLDAEIQEWTKTDLAFDSSMVSWRYAIVYKILFQLYKKEKLTDSVAELFKNLAEKCPEALILGLTPHFEYGLEKLRNMMHNAIVKVICLTSNTSHHKTSIILQRLWGSYKENLNCNQKVLLEALVDVYENAKPEDQTNKLLRILEITQDLKALGYLLNQPSYLFIIDLASVASRREYLKLDKWINDKLMLIGQPFVEACKYYVQHRVMKVDNLPEQKSSLPSHTETLGIIVSCLQNYFSKIESTTGIYSNDMKDIFKMNADIQMYKNNKIEDANQQTLTNQQPTEKTNPTGNENVFPDEVQLQCDAYFKKIFSLVSPNEEIFDKIFDFLNKMRYSKDRQEQLLFDCMIQTLIKELDFLSQYQAEELSIMGEMIGGIIDRQFVENNLLSFVLQKIYFIINSSKKDSNLLNFALRALNRCQARLKQYPMLCEKLSIADSNSNVHKLEQKVSEHVNDDNNNQKTAKDASKNATQESVQLDLDYRDRLNFAFNNLDDNNVEHIANQFKETCDKNLNFVEILADCLTHRAIAEANHHQLFYKLLEILNSNLLFDSVIMKTYEKIRVYLMGIENGNQSQRLYSSGKWLGMLTLQRNKPILSLHLDLHSLLIEATNKNLTFYIVPFIVRILNSCAESKVFQPPNPWLITLLKMLMKTYVRPESKMKIKFEIESLFKLLKLELDDYMTISQVSIKESMTCYEEYLHPSDSNNNVHINRNKVEKATKPPQTKTDSREIEKTTINSIKPTNFVDLFEILVQNIKISSNLIQMMQLTVEFIDQIRQQIVKSVQELITSSSETYSRILSVIEILIQKDFANESNPEIVRLAAINMTRYLTSGYTLINCRELLSIAMTEKLRHLFVQLNNQNSKQIRLMPEDAISFIVNDNISLCISFIQKLFIEKAVEEVLDRIKEFLDRKSEIENQNEPSQLEDYSNSIYFKDLADISIFTNHPTPPAHTTVQPTAAFSYPIQEEQNSNEVVVDSKYEIKVKLIFEEWFKFHHGLENNYQNVHAELLKTRFFKNEESLYSFLRICFTHCYDRCRQLFKPQSGNNLYITHYECFALLDVFVSMVLFLIKYEKLEFKIIVLDHVLTDLSRQAQNEQQRNGLQFNPLCYYRIVVLFYLEFVNEITTYQSNRSPITKNIPPIPNQQLQTKFSLMGIFYDFLKSMSPLVIPSFTFAWLDFISHRAFIGNFLSNDIRKLWKYYYLLLKDLLEFEKPFFQTSDLQSESFKFLHGGTVKLFLLLLHDFPDFLSQFGFLICDHLPENAFQFRNIIFSAFNSNITPINPLSPNLNMDNMDAILHPYCGDFSAESPLKVYVDSYFQSGKLFHLKKLPTYFNTAKSLQIEYMNRILYCVTQYIVSNDIDTNVDKISEDPALKMIEFLLDYFDSECQYYMFGAMANHLRYPNIDTKYFTCLLLYFYMEYPNLREIIIRVLLERIYIRGPYPWGLVYIFKEFKQNPVYNFKDFIDNLNPQAKSIFQKYGLYSAERTA